MSKYLFIVESPNKCGKIKSFLGSDYNVVASVGHIREIPRKGMNIDIKGGTFEPTFEISSDKRDVVKRIKEEAKKASVIYLATDFDREGEGIAQHLYDVLDKESQKKCKRITFVEITKNAILDALKNPRDIDKNLVDAQKARQVLDRLIGYKVSPWLIFAQRISGSSAGRVQSICLQLIVDRDNQIASFKPEDYWFIEALLKCQKGEFWAKVITKDKDNRYLNEKIATEDLEKLKKASYIVDKIEKAEKRNNPPPPFDTNSLQATCSSLFGWSLSKSQTIAQKLYEAGRVSYIRTDSFNISQEALDGVRTLIKSNYSSEYLPKQANVYAKKSGASSQEAHECIRPTHIENTSDDIGDESEKRMYELIRDRFICCQMTPQIVDTVAYFVKANSGHDLIARGQTIKFDGWSKIYKYSKTKEEVLPDASEKEKLDLKDIKKTKHTTQPPARYNEGTLAKAMEKEGVGRPSTRAGIITNIQKKGYVEKDKKSKGLISTSLGAKICERLKPNFKDFFMDIKYTAKLEGDLDEMANGKKKYLEVITAVYEVLQKHIKDAGGNTDFEKKPQITTGEKCTVCKKGEIIERMGKYGKFYACNKYPSCQTIYSKGDDGKFIVKQKQPNKSKKTGKKCPECEKKGKCGELVERINKSNGQTFIACNQYPRCTYIEKDKNTEKGSQKNTKEKEKDEGGTEDLEIDLN